MLYFKPPVALSCALVLALTGLSGCKPRTFNKSSAAVKSTTAAAWTDDPNFPPSDVPVLDYAKRTDKKGVLPANHNEDRLLYTGNLDVDDTTAITPIGVQFTDDPKDQTVFGKLMIAQLRIPSFYQNNYVKRPARGLTRPLGKQKTLEALNTMRAAWFEYQPDGKKLTEPRIKSLKALQAVTKDGILMSGDFLKNKETDGASCMSGNAASHWNDIQMHYYCNLPHAFRNCWSQGSRGMVTSTSQALQNNVKPRFPYESHRAELWKICTDPKYMEQVAKADEIISGSLGGYSGDTTGPVKASEAFKIFAEDESNFIDDGQGKKVNIFRYFMLHQTYAFDWQEQQDVVNAWYGAYAPGGKFDPANSDECFKFRPARQIEASPRLEYDYNTGTSSVNPEDVGMEIDFCLATKRNTSPMIAQGR